MIVPTPKAGAAVDGLNTDVMQSTPDLLILKMLSLQPMHGFGMARRVSAVVRLLKAEA